MIARNEEDVIGRAILSIREVADEIIVVDTGSGDGTANLARRLGADVSFFAWRNNFAEARNASLERASGEWVLVLDADEFLEADQAKALRQFVETSKSDGAVVTLLNEMGDDELLDSTSHQYTRLFRNYAEFKFVGVIHEQIIQSMLAADASVEHTNITIKHTGYAHPSNSKLLRNLRLLQSEIASRPDDAFMRFHLGSTLFAMKQNTKARDEFLKVVESAYDFSSLQVRSAESAGRTFISRSDYLLALIRLGQIALTDGDTSQTKEWASRVLHLDPENALALYLLAAGLFEGGHYFEALGALNKIRTSTSANVKQDKVLVDMGNCLFRVGRPADAAKLYAAAATTAPSAIAAFNCGNALLQCGRLKEAEHYYQLALRYNPTLAEAKQNLVVCRHMLSQKRDAA
jgi:glycosyltransferase involved in cell wall biosynthesis